MRPIQIFLLTMLVILFSVTISAAKDFTTFTNTEDYKQIDLDDILTFPRPEQSKLEILFKDKNWRFEAILQSFADACDTKYLKIIARMAASGEDDFDDYHTSKCMTVKSRQGKSVKLHVKDQQLENLSKDAKIGDTIIIYGNCLYMVNSGPGIIIDKVELFTK